MKKLAAITIATLLSIVSLFAQAPDTLWTKTFGGNYDDFGLDVQQCFDGNYVIVGFTGGLGSYDVWLIKTDPSGDTLWSKTIGGNLLDMGMSIHQTLDSGFVVAGITGSDIWLIKTNQIGDTLWTKTYGGAGTEYIEFPSSAVKQTTDMGYIIAGSTNSFGSGNYDGWLIKTDSSGDTIWTRTFGGNGEDRLHSVIQTEDGGYAVVGHTSADVWIIKTDSLGNILWSKSVSSTVNSLDRGYAIKQTYEGGYVIAGYTQLPSAGLGEVWLIKTDSLGDTLWTKIFGGSLWDIGCDIQITSDSGYIIAGATTSYAIGDSDVWVLRTNATGDTLWNITIGEIDTDVGYSIVQSGDEEYIIVGRTYNITRSSIDVYLIKIGLKPLTLLYPNGGEYWLNGTTEPIVWLSENIDDVMIELSIDNGRSWDTIVDSTASTGLYVWTVNSPVYSSECLVRIRDLSSPDYYDESDSVFTIDIVPSVKNFTEEGIPKEFELSQNYPNPFNPNTTINFAVPNPCFVELKLYDVLGNELSTMVSEPKIAGFYSVDFNASKLSSGLYFYRLKAGEFTETKKMVLLK